jgi:hypothetical protein
MMENIEPKPISELRPKDYNSAVDLRGEPTHVCICGCDVWNVKAAFHDYEMSYYYRDMECANCGSLATAPTPLDMPEDYQPTYDCCPQDDCGEH